MIKNINILPVLSLFIISIWIACDADPDHDITANDVTPTPIQLAYQQMEMVGFIHFGLNTYTDKEWGYGDESPSLFNPIHLDAEQWIEAAQAAGMKELILTAKHHDGFCLWPSKYTEHSIKNSPYKEGNGDIVRELTEACRKHGLKVGLYLSPWDRNHKDYGTPAYIDYYRNQLTELLTEYGDIHEIWFDGANGGDGYYGGANETRTIDRNTYYDWDSTFSLVKKLQPDVLIFSDAGPDIHWIGNEHGFAGESFWSTINKSKLVIGASDPAYLNSGDPEGSDWIIGQCDVSIRPGWFYHASQDSLVKSVDHLLDIYYKSVGRNALLLLNLPPNQDGLIPEADIDTLRAMKSIIDQTFEINLVEKVQDANSNKIVTEELIDNDLSTFWSVEENSDNYMLDLWIKPNSRFDRLLLQEPIQFGQRIESYEVQGYQDGEWNTIHRGSTIGYKRLIRFDQPILIEKVRIKVTKSNNAPALSGIGAYLSPQ